MGRNWYVQGPDGKTAGPFSSRQLVDAAANGAVRPETPVRLSDQTEWRPAKSLRGLEFADAKQPPPAPMEPLHAPLPARWAKTRTAKAMGVAFLCAIAWMAGRAGRAPQVDREAARVAYDAFVHVRNGAEGIGDRLFVADHAIYLALETNDRQRREAYLQAALSCVLVAQFQADQVVTGEAVPQIHAAHGAASGEIIEWLERSQGEIFSDAQTRGMAAGLGHGELSEENAD